MEGTMKSHHPLKGGGSQNYTTHRKIGGSQTHIDVGSQKSILLFTGKMPN